MRLSRRDIYFGIGEWARELVINWSCWFANYSNPTDMGRIKIKARAGRYIRDDSKSSDTPENA